jgi:hypothetical protein
MSEATIPCHQNDGATAGDQPLTIVDAAAELKLPPPTLHRWINEGFITGEQLTPGAPWRIRLTDEVRALGVDDAPDAGSRRSKPPSRTACPARPS